MKIKILIGNMLVLTMLLLMPSIPAIQQETVEEKAYNDFLEQLDDFDFKDKNEIKIFEDGFWDEHPILGFLMYIAALRLEWGFKLVDFSLDLGGPTIIHPLIFLRGCWVIGTAMGLAALIYVFIYIVGWSWWSTTHSID